MDKKNAKLSAVEESEYGLYVWLTKDNLRVEDEDGNVMNIPARKGDVKAINALREAAEYYGVAEGGRPFFYSRRRRVTDAELEYQHERLRAGLIPDPLDFKAMEEEQKYARKHGN